jgi:hypothetical protein
MDDISDQIATIASETSFRFPVKDEGDIITQSLLAPLLLLSSLSELSSLELTGAPQTS